MSFTPKQTYSNSDEREQQSIEFVNGLLKGTSAYPELKSGEKGANIDGYIQLLDENRKIDGKLTVQVKTVSPSNEGKNVFPCPTSLFAYAERTIDVVFLMAVDHSQQVVLWKYISRPLVNANQNKTEQETIMLHFEESERLSRDNIHETIKKWKSLFLQQRLLIETADVVKNENEKLRHQLVKVEAPAFTLPISEVVKIQMFSDMYNRLLDREFNYVKKYCYPRMWKQGIAIFEYQDTELLYSLYPINYGENSLLIKQLPKETFGKTHYNLACHSSIDNKIKTDIVTVVRNRISEDVKSFFNKPMPIPPYENYIIEYIREFVKQYYIALGVSANIKDDYQALKHVFEKRFDHHENKSTLVIIGHNYINLDLIYDCVNFLLNRGYKGDVELYPPKRLYGNTGKVSDWFNPELAFEKTQIVLNYVYLTYSDFINKYFPYIKDKLDMYFNADYVLINLDYEKCPQITVNNFYCLDKTNNQSKAKVEFCLGQRHELFTKYPIYPHHTFIGKSIIYNDLTYICNNSFNFDTQKVLFGRSCLTDSFYEVLKSRLEKFVKDMDI